MPQHSYGRLIERRRRELKLSQRAVAEQLGLEHVYYGNVERGSKPPFPDEHVEALAAVLDLDPHVLRMEAANCRPIKLDVTDQAEEIKELGVLLARRINTRSLSPEAARTIRQALQPTKEDDPS